MGTNAGLARWQHGKPGEHYQLINVLNKMGYTPRSREEAMELAEGLLAHGYRTP